MSLILRIGRHTFSRKPIVLSSFSEFSSLTKTQNDPMIVLISYRNLVWPRIFDTILSLIQTNQDRLRPPMLPRLSEEAVKGLEKRLGVIGQDIQGNLSAWIEEWSSEIGQKAPENIQGNPKEPTQGSIQTQNQSFRSLENRGGYTAETGGSIGLNPEKKAVKTDITESRGVYGPYFSLYHYICPSLSDPMISALNLQKLPASVLYGGGMVVDCFEGGSETRAADQLETLRSLIGLQHENQTLRRQILELERAIGKETEGMDLAAMRQLAAEIAPHVSDDPALHRLIHILHLDFTRRKNQPNLAQSNDDLLDFNDLDTLLRPLNASTPQPLNPSLVCKHILQALETAPVEYRDLLEEKFLLTAEKVADHREKAQLIGEFSRLINQCLPYESKHPGGGEQSTRGDNQRKRNQHREKSLQILGKKRDNLAVDPSYSRSVITIDRGEQRSEVVEIYIMSDQFDAAAKHVRELKKEQVTEEVGLKLYSLYKQATEGPNQRPEPSSLDFAGHKKWKAWKALGALGKEEAKQQYIAEANKFK